MTEPPSAASPANAASPPAALERARALLQTGHYEAAAALAAPVARDFPEQALAWQILALARRKLGDAAGALAPMTRAAELMPNVAQAQFDLALLHHTLGRAAEAATHYRRAIELRPEHIEALNNLGSLLLASGQAADAEACFRRALALRPDLAALHFNLGNALTAQRRAGEAEAAFVHALSLRPDTPEALVNLGALLVGQLRFGEAEPLYRRAIALQPGLASAHHGLALALQGQNRFAEAVGEFEVALKQTPDDVDTKLKLCAAVSLLGLGDPRQASACADRLSRAHADDPIIRRGLAGLRATAETPSSDDDRVFARELFDQLADSFDRHLTDLGYGIPQQMAALLDLAALAPSPSLDVLDTGCGTGLCAPYLRPVARHLAGVDLSRRMLEIARDKALYDTLHEADCCEFMHQHGERFDLVFASDVLTYISDAAALFRAAQSALRAGGRIAVSAERSDTGSAAAHLCTAARYQHSRQALTAAVAASGLELEDIAPGTMRREAEVPVPAWIVVARKKQRD